MEDKLEEIQRIDVRNEKTAIGYMLQDETAAILASRVLHEVLSHSLCLACIKADQSCYGKR